MVTKERDSKLIQERRAVDTKELKSKKRVDEGESRQWEELGREVQRM